MGKRLFRSVGGYRKTERIDDIEITQHRPATINWSPYQDLKMVYYFDHIQNYGIDCTLISKSIVKTSIKEINNPNTKKLR